MVPVGGIMTEIRNVKPFSLLSAGTIFRICHHGKKLMKVQGIFPAVYLEGSRRGKRWSPKKHAGQLVYLEEA